MPHGQILMMHLNTFRNLGFQQAYMSNKNGASMEKTIVGVSFEKQLSFEKLFEISFMVFKFLILFMVASVCSTCQRIRKNI